MAIILVVLPSHPKRKNYQIPFEGKFPPKLYTCFDKTLKFNLAKFDTNVT